MDCVCKDLGGFRMLPKFRAWHKKDKKMYDIWALYSKVNYIDLEVNDFYAYKRERLDEVEIMQATGLFDKNGVEIFEGDILKYKFMYDKRVKTFGFVVKRIDKATFGLEDIRGLTTEQIELYRVVANNHFQIIGNIYESPELVQQ